jgi:hypothetical protein
MNQKLCKLIRKYARIRGLEYEYCKDLFQKSKSTPGKQDLFRQEMQAAVDNPQPVLLRQPMLLHKKV